jgi:hypothetical protein
VQGSGWPAGAEVLFGWDGTGAADRGYTGNAQATPDAQGNFTANFTITGSKVTEGTHTLYALVILTGQQARAPLYVPCSAVPTPTPTWTATPTNTPTSTATPVRKPDLEISALYIQGTEIVTGTSYFIDTTVLNDSTGPCNNTFWTDLYVYEYTGTLRIPLPREDGVRYQALTYLGPSSTKDIQFVYTFPVTGTYHLYAQADTYENVTEMDESNNVRGPVQVIVKPNPNPSTATPTATPGPDCDSVPPTGGSVAGTVWAFIEGQLVVPTERVSLSLWENRDGQSVVVATTQSGLDGRYPAEDLPWCVSPGTGYTVNALVVIDGVDYFNIQTGIQVVAGQVTSPVDITVYHW